VAAGFGREAQRVDPGFHLRRLSLKPSLELVGGERQDRHGASGAPARIAKGPSDRKGRDHVMADFKIVLGNKNYSSWSLRGWLALIPNLDSYRPFHGAKRSAG
jgi:hypothetical protein